MSIEERQFVPRELTVGLGDEVTWTHRDGDQVHSVTGEDGSFDSNPLCSTANPKECMSDHDTFKVTFGAEGRFPYFSKTFGGPGGPRGVRCDRGGGRSPTGAEEESGKIIAAFPSGPGPGRADDGNGEWD